MMGVANNNSQCLKVGASYVLCFKEYLKLFCLINLSRLTDFLGTKDAIIATLSSKSVKIPGH